jgi:hypothetical protein
MNNVPPTPFYLRLKIQFSITPYKILETLIDWTKELSDAFVNLEKEIAKIIGQLISKNSKNSNNSKIHSSAFMHSLDKNIDATIKTQKSKVAKAFNHLKKETNIKFLNKQFIKSVIINFPIEPAG